jgi:hypothetical protein
MSNKHVHSSVREIKPTGRLGISINPDKNAPIGSNGVIKALCVSPTGETLTTKLSYQIVAESIKPSKTQRSMPIVKIVWVDCDNDDDLWRSMTDHSCFTDDDDLISKISYDIGLIDNTGTIILKVNSKFPEYVARLNQCTSKSLQTTFTKGVAKELTHMVLINEMNSKWPKPKEGDENYDTGDCGDYVDYMKYRLYNNDFTNICYRVFDQIDKKLKAKESDN